MIISVRDWLPAGVLGQESVERVLNAAVAAWSARWFGQTAATLHVPASVAAAADLSVSGVSTTLCLSGPGKGTLLEAILQVRLATEKKQPADLQLLDALARESLMDLARELDACLLGDRGDDDVHLEIAIGGLSALRVTVSEASLIRAIKAAMVSSKRHGTPVPRLAGLGRSKVSLQAILGRVTVTAEEISGIATGDVLVLDRGLHEKVELRLAGSRKTLANGKLLQGDGRTSVQL